MKNKLKINKEGLWGKIVQDERMPKKDQKKSVVKKYWLGLFILTCLCSTAGYLLLERKESLVEKVTYELEQNDRKFTEQTTKELPVKNKKKNTTLISDSESTDQKSPTSYQQSKSPTKHGVNRDSSSENNDVSKSLSKESHTPKIIINNSSASPVSIPYNTTENNSQEVATKPADENILQGKPSNPIEYISGVSDYILRNSNNQKLKNKATSLTSRETLTDYTELLTTSELSPDNYIDKNYPKIKNPTDRLDNSDQAYTRDKLERLAFLPGRKPTIGNQDLHPTVRKPIFAYPTKTKKLSLFISFAYGSGIRTSFDSLGRDLGDNNPYEERVDSYQFELGVSRTYGSWSGRIGLGADITEGRGVWVEVDTLYTEFSLRNSYERLENTTDHIVYQRYGNLYLSSGIDYQLRHKAWSIVPRLGLKYNLFDLTNGNIIENAAFQKTDIKNLGKKQKIVYSFALELQREISQHLSLVLGAKYETNVTYNVSSQLKQSIRPLYLSVGGQYRF